MENRGGVLLVDDDPIYLRAMERLLEGAGIAPVMLHDRCGGALEQVEAFQPDLVCLDLDLGGIDGRHLISKLRSGWPGIEVVIVSGTSNRDVMEECRRAGAADFVSKPFLPESFLQVVRKIRGEGNPAITREREKPTSQRVPAWNAPAFSGILTSSPRMHELFRYAASIATSSLPILITGETGTGKELMAKALHQLRVPDGPLVPINAAGLDDSMFSDALFGHVAGAFTGGDRARPGLVETAGEGTLFLDEIGDLSPASQVKLLRLLQENEYHPVGADRPRRSRCRFILATHKDLEHEPTFRKDLYWRICSHRIQIPPLRDRPEDIELLVRHFITDAARELHREEPVLGEPFIQELLERKYPGNIRELRNFVFDQVARCTGLRLECGTGRVRNDLRSSVATVAPFPTLAEIQAIHIVRALERTGGNRTAAAELLGVSRQTLITHLKKDGSQVSSETEAKQISITGI